MGFRVKTILRPTGQDRRRVSGEMPDEHPSDDTIARLVDGDLSHEELSQVLKHINCCPMCYDVYVEALRQNSDAATRSNRKKFNFWTKYAIAASFLLCISLGAIFYILHDNNHIRMNIVLDENLREEILKIGTKQEMASQSLLSSLREHGVPVDGVHEVVMLEPYMPTKDFLDSKERLEVSIVDKVVYLKVSCDNNGLEN